MLIKDKRKLREPSSIEIMGNELAVGDMLRLENGSTVIVDRPPFRNNPMLRLLDSKSGKQIYRSPDLLVSQFQSGEVRFEHLPLPKRTLRYVSPMRTIKIASTICAVKSMSLCITKRLPAQPEKNDLKRLAYCTILIKIWLIENPWRSPKNHPATKPSGFG